MTTLGTGEFQYRVDGDWGRLPDGWALNDVAGIAVDAQDNVYVFNRGAHPMIVFDQDGVFLRAWGEGLFTSAHGLHIGPDGNLYCTDNGDHTVRKCTPWGEVLLTIGIPGRAAPYMGGEPFNRCTHTALSPRGDIYVADGYGNARVHKYDPAGRPSSAWGAPGCGPGEFNIVHNICADDDGWVYVADRENHRIQVFDGDGRFETQWNNVHRPSAIFIRPGHRQNCYVGELGPFMSINRDMPNIGPRVSILDPEGRALARLGDPAGAGLALDQFIAPHGIAVDSHGDIYLGEVSFTTWPMAYPADVPIPPHLRSLRKLVHVDIDVQDDAGSRMELHDAA